MTWMRRIAKFCVLAGAMSIAIVAQALDTHWNTSSDGIFTTPANWDHGVPGTADTAIFNRGNAETYTVTFPGSVFGSPVYTVDKLVVSRNSVSFTRGAGIFGPSLVVSGASLRPDQVSIASLGVTGPGAKLTTAIPVSATRVEILADSSPAAELDIGNTLTISADSSAALTLSDAAIVKIINGGSLELTGSDGDIILYNELMGFQPKLNVDGDGSTLRMDGIGTLYAGDGPFGGNAVIEVTNGGRIDDAVASIGSTPPFPFLPGESPGSAQVIVSGPTSLWTNRDHLDVGLADPAPVSTVTLVSGGTVAVTNLFSLGPNGMIIGSGSVKAALLVNQGFVSPGFSALGTHLPGVLHLNDSFVQLGSGHVQINLSGTTAGTLYDQVLVSGGSALGGMLDVLLANDFMPAAGDSFHIFDFGARSGTFASVNLPTLSAGLTWNTSQLYTTGTISVASAGIPGDYNGNGVVDAADYTVWRDHLGQTFTLPNEDPATTPGQVTAEDYVFWKSHFGQTTGSGSALPSAASQCVVPEPSTVMLLILAATSALIMPIKVRGPCA